jgi:hypothetical protein
MFNPYKRTKTMKHSMITLAAAASLSLVAATLPVHADNSPTYPWTTPAVGPWAVRVDPSMGNGCYMTAYYSTGDMFRLGYDNRNNSVFVSIQNNNWKSLVPGQKYEVVAQIDGGPLTTLQAMAWKVQTGMMLAAEFSNPQQVVDLFSSGSNFQLFYQGKRISNLQLTGTAAAAAQVTACNRAYAGTTPGSDPFAMTTTAPQVDPFKGGI